MKNPPWELEITWYWRSEGKGNLNTDTVSATSVPRAISKLKKELADEGNEEVNKDLVVVQVTNNNL